MNMDFKINRIVALHSTKKSQSIFQLHIYSFCVKMKDRKHTGLKKVQQQTGNEKCNIQR